MRQCVSYQISKQYVVNKTAVDALDASGGVLDRSRSLTIESETGVTAENYTYTPPALPRMRLSVYVDAWGSLTRPKRRMAAAADSGPMHTQMPYSRRNACFPRCTSACTIVEAEVPMEISEFDKLCAYVHAH